MKRWLIIALAVALLAGLGTWTLARKLAPAPASAAAFDPEQARLAIRFLDLLDAAEYEAALAMATPRLQQGLAGGKLQQAWEGGDRSILCAVYRVTGGTTIGSVRGTAQ